MSNTDAQEILEILKKAFPNLVFHLWPVEASGSNYYLYSTSEFSAVLSRLNLTVNHATCKCAAFKYSTGYQKGALISGTSSLSAVKAINLCLMYEARFACQKGRFEDAYTLLRQLHAYS